MKLKRPKEDQEQEAFIEWCRYHPIIKDYIFHIPNEGKRPVQYLMKLHRMGLRKGVSDLFFPYPCHGKHGMWIEMKTSRGKLSKEQREWLNRMNHIGYVAIMVRGWEMAKKQVETYLDGTIVYENEI